MEFRIFAKPNKKGFALGGTITDKMRWRYGDTNPVIAAVDSATVIEIGDILYLDTDDAKPASAQPDQSTKADNQALLADNFLGIAMQRSCSGDTDPIRVATKGVFEFDCPSSRWELGDLVGVDEQPCGKNLEHQKVDKVEVAEHAIARCARRAPVATTNVLIDVFVRLS